jgi:hypothetical protein
MNRTLSAVVVALMSAGCAVGPDYVTPDTTFPKQFLGDEGKPTPEEISLTLTTRFSHNSLPTPFVITTIFRALSLGLINREPSTTRPS